MPGAGFGFPSRINPPGEQPVPNPGGSGLNPDAARRFEQLERRLDEVMKRLEQMSRDKR
jgi:predicted transcriptional regulator